MRRSALFVSVCSILLGASSGCRRVPSIASALERHRAALLLGVSLIRSVVDDELLQLLAPQYQQKLVVQRFVEKEHTLVDASLDMSAALHAALGLEYHAVHRPVSLVLSKVVQLVANMPVNDLVGHRDEVRRVIRRVSKVVRPLTVELRRLVPEFAVPIAGQVDFGLIEAMVQAFCWKHESLVDCLICGFCPIGKVPCTGVHRPVTEPDCEPITRESNAAQFDEVSRLFAERRRSASAQALEDMDFVWRGALEERDKGFCVGPLSRRGVEELFQSSEFGPRPIPSFCIWQKGKPRRIDDALRSLHNAMTRMSETIVCETADLPARLAAEFAKYLDLSSLRLRLGTDDIASAYRILVSAAPQYNVAAVWQPEWVDGVGKVRYFALRGFNFGLKSAPVHLATLMKPLVDFATKLFLVACGDFYDDVVVVDPRDAGSSGQSSLEFFFQKVGFPFADKKHERMRSSNAFLGVVTDFTSIALGWIVLRVKESRRRKLLQELKEVRDEGKLSSARAARIRGKLYFLTTTSFYGVGRPALQAFTARQYSKAKSKELDEGLTGAISFFIQLLDSLPAFRFALRASNDKPLYVWTDAAWEPSLDEAGELVTALDGDGELFYLGQASIAFVVFDPRQNKWYEGHKDIHFEVLRHMVPGKKTYIGQLEALAAECVLETLPASVLKEREVMWWIDNLAAKYGLQKGYSKVDDSGRIINAFKIKQAELKMRIWFEYVPSHQNLADLPSRGKMDEMFQVVAALARMAGANDWVFEHFDEVQLPDFSTWLAPLAALTDRKRKNRTGSRGERRRRRNDSGCA